MLIAQLLSQYMGMVPVSIPSSARMDLNHIASLAPSMLHKILHQ
jgi:hypothetical protein